MRDCFLGFSLGCRLRQPWVKAPCYCTSWTICRCHHPPMNFLWKLLPWPNWSGRGSATQVHDNKRSWQIRNKRWWIAIAVYFRMDIHKLILEWSRIFLEVAESIIEDCFHFLCIFMKAFAIWIVGSNVSLFCLTFILCKVFQWTVYWFRTSFILSPLSFAQGFIWFLFLSCQTYLKWSWKVMCW